MKNLKVWAIAVLTAGLLSSPAFPQEILVCVSARGETGLEGRVKNVMEREFQKIEHVTVTDDREACHLFIGLALIEQEPIHFYGLGVSIAYHVRGEFYSQPSTDVAQFGEERMEDVLVYLAGEIDKAFLGPLKKPIE